MSQPWRVWRYLAVHRYWGVTLLTLGGFSLSLLIATKIQQWEFAQRQEQFTQQATEIAGRLQSQLDLYTQLTRAVGALYATSEQVEAEEFRAFSRSLLPYADGLAGFGSTQLPPNTDHQFSTPYIELGVAYSLTHPDVTTNPARQAVLSKVERLGAPATTPLTTLETGQMGFALYHPLFNGEDHRFQGAVFSLYALEDWLETAIATLDTQDISFALYQLPLDQLDSALRKPRVKASQRFLIAYDANTKELSRSGAIAELDNGTTPLPHNRCPYPTWEACLRSVSMERQELSLLLLPTQPGWLAYSRAGAIAAIGCLSTLLISVYLARSQQSARRTASHNQQLQTLLTQLKQTQAKLLHTEKMSSLGQLVAGIAHEINNPTNFISGNIHYVQQYVGDILELVCLYQIHYPQPHTEITNLREEIELDFLIEDLNKVLESITTGANRISEIVRSMRNFSRLDEAEIKAVDLHSGLNSTLLILNSRLKAQGNRSEIQVLKDYGELPLVECYAGQLNQVFMNLLANAIDAIAAEPDPRITITTRVLNAEQVEIAIANNGPPIPPEIQSRLFDPFFTTKPVGQGTGLGLSISYQVVTEHHGGQLHCESSTGQDTCFRITLPIHHSAQSMSIV